MLQSQERLAQAPEAIGRFGIDRIRHHANLAGRIDAPFSLILHQQGDVAVLAIDTAHSVELRARCAPDAGRRPLLGRLQGLRRVEDRLPVLVDYTGLPEVLVRSAINRRHDPIGVTLPRDFSGRQSTVEHLHLYGIKLDGLGGHILFKIFPVLSAGDRHDVLALVQ